MISSKTITAIISYQLSRIGLSLLLMGSFISGSAQIYIADNASFVGEDFIHLSTIDEVFETTKDEPTKIYVIGDTKIVNLSENNSSVEIVYLEKESYPKKENILPIINQPIQVIAKVEVKPKDEKIKISFLSKGNTSATLFYTAKVTQGFIVPTNDLTSKALIANLNPVNYPYFLNANETNRNVYSMNTHFIVLPIYLENPTTRPPPFLALS